MKLKSFQFLDRYGGGSAELPPWTCKGQTLAWLTEPMGGSSEGQRSPGPLLKEEILEGAGVDSPGNTKQLKHEPVVEETN